MQKKKYRYSIRTGILILLVLILVPVSIGLLVMSGYTKQKLRYEVALSTQTFLEKQSDNLEKSLKQDRNYLANMFTTDTELNILKKDSNSDDSAHYIYEIRQKLLKNQAEGSIGEVYFLLFKDDLYSTFAIQGSYARTEKIQIENHLKGWDWENETPSMIQRLIKIDEKWYYVLAFRTQELCLGELIRMDTLLENVAMADNHGLLSFVNNDQQFLGNEAWVQERQIAFDNSSKKEFYRTGKGKSYVVLKYGIDQLPGDLVYIMEDEEILGDLKPISNLISMIAIAMLILIPLSLMATHVILFKPLNRLKYVIMQIKKGGMDKKANTEGVSKEMFEVYDLFNEMMDEIEHFKILSYEEEIRKKDYQLQYFTLQVEPHFYLNSMKCVYALIESQEFEKAQSMVLNLSDYLKNVTYDHQTVVSVARELEHVSIYMEIRQAGVENEIICRLNMDNRARKLNVPLLCVQTFVENSIKYGLVHGHNLEIDIRITLLELGEKQYLDIIIMDNGNGYSKEIIKAINQENVEPISGHIGLTNLWNRLKIIYKDEAFMTVSNRPAGGAYSELLFPVREDGR